MAAISGDLAEKAHMLLEQRRVLVHASFHGISDAPHPDPADRPFAYAYVMGDSEPYIVKASRGGVHCTCPAGRYFGQPRCAHALAAMVTWAELC
jgi:hypothetical protein